jgi:FHS family glucose/mannose:H+ symporter-like MFS transporter
MSTSALARRRIPVTTSGTTLIHLDFLVTGIVMTFLGPMLPILSSRWSLPDVRAGYLIFAQFFSSMFGMLLSGWLVQRIGYRLTLIIGLVLMASGMVMLAFGPFLLGIISVCVLGVGYGVTSPAGNLRTAEVNPHRSAAALNVINAVWGVGAMSSPFLIVLAQRVHRPSLFLFGTATALLVLLLAFAIARFEPDTHAAPKLSGVGKSPWQSPMLLVVCVLFFIYVGTETSFGGWVAMYARRMESGHNSLWTITPSFFWGALLVGRSLAPIALNYFSETVVARAGLTLALAGGIALIDAHGVPLIVTGTVLAGLGLASIFPISVSLLPGWFGDSARSASGAVFSAGNMGGAVLPWVVGAISTRYDSLRTAFFVPLAGVALMLGFYLLGRTSELHAAKLPQKNC